MSYSNLAHIPWAIGIGAVCAGAALLGVPISFIGAFAGSTAMVSRAETKGEYQGIADKFGGLRANMPAWYGFKFWYWNSHTQLETLWAILASFAVAGLVFRLFGI